jgi:hypothetical protein
MNPDDPVDLKTALKRLARVRINARKAGDTLTPEDEEEFVRGITGGKYGRADIGNLPGNYAASFGQGVAMNWLDEAVGLVSPEAKENLRIRGETFREEHPVADVALGIAGGVAVPGFGAAKVAGRGAVGLGREALRAAGLGAGAGAVAGAGAAENIEDIPKEAAVGGAAGGVLGGLVGGTVGGVKHFFGRGTKAANLRERLVQEAGGEDVIRREAQRLERYEPDITAAEASPNLIGKAKALIASHPGLYEETSQNMIARESFANARLARGLDNAGNPTAPAGDVLKGIRAQRRAFADSDPGYAGLRARNPEVPGLEGLQYAIDPPPSTGPVVQIGSEKIQLPGPDFPFIAEEVEKGLSRILKEPRLKRAWKAAKEVGALGPLPDRGNPSFQQLQDVAENLEDQIDVAFKAGKGNLGRRLKEARDFLVAHIEEHVPDYRGVTQEYHRLRSMERGVQMGRDLFKANANNFRDVVLATKNLVMDGQTTASFVLRNEFVESIRNANTGRSMARKILTEPLMQQKLRLAFKFDPNPRAFDDFMTEVRARAQIARGKSIAAGSETAVRTAGRGTSKSLPEAAGESAISGSVLAATTRIPRAVGRAAVRNSQSAAEEQVLRELLAPGMAGVDNFLRAASTRMPRVGGRASAVAPAVSSVMAQRIKELFDR